MIWRIQVISVILIVLVTWSSCYKAPAPPAPRHPFTHAGNHSQIVILSHTLTPATAILDMYEAVKASKQLATKVRLVACPLQSTDEPGGKKSFLVSLVSLPRYYVFDQFMKCFTAAKSKKSVLDIFPQWIHFFHHKYHQKNSQKEAVNPLPACVFDPFNPQSQLFLDSCLSNTPKTNITTANEVTGTLSHRKDASSHHRVDFLGIADFYDASKCMLWYYLGEQSNLLKCKSNKINDSSIMHQRQVQLNKQGYRNITVETWRQVDQLTEEDIKLYKQAVFRFVENLKLFEYRANCSLSSQMEMSADLVLTLTRVT